MGKIHQRTHDHVTTSEIKPTANNLSTLTASEIGANAVSLIKIVGIGGAGCNFIERALLSKLQVTGLIAADTDASLLNRSHAQWKLHFDANGLDSNAEGELSRVAVDAHRREISKSLAGAEIVFIVAGMGGATATAAATLVAKVACEMPPLTVGIVFKPSPLEGRQRMKCADKGIAELVKYVDCLLVIPNDMHTHPPGVQSRIENGFYTANAVSQNTIADIVEILAKPCLVNINFEDMRAILAKKGLCRVGFGSASGANRAKIAAKQAIASILREGTETSCPKGMIANITAARTGFKMKEISDAISTVRYFAAEGAPVIFGVVLDELMGDAIRVTLVANGI